MELYTAGEMAKLLQVHIKTVYKWGEQGKIGKMKIGRSVRFFLPEIGEKDAYREIDE